MRGALLVERRQQQQAGMICVLSYVPSADKQTQNAKKKMQRKKETAVEVGLEPQTPKKKGSPNAKILEPAAYFHVLFRKTNITLHTAHARITHGARHAACSNLNDNVPETCAFTGNPEMLRRRVHFVFQRDTYERKTRTF